MKTMEVIFWTAGGILTRGELVNPATVLPGEDGRLFVRMQRALNQHVDVVSSHDGELRAHSVPITRIRSIRMLVAA